MRELTAIVPFWNGHDTIWRLIASLPVGLPIIVVDDHSDRAFTLELPDDAKPEGWGQRSIEVIRPQEKGYFSGAVNAGILACDTDVLILNQDVWLEGDGWIDHLEGLRARYQIAGDGVMNHYPSPFGYVQGTFMYVARALIERVGLLNGRDYPLWGATREYQLRACRKGFKAYPTGEFLRWMRHERRAAGSKFGSAITEALRREPERRKEFTRIPPVISVVVPCYNYGRYLKDCIASMIGGDTCLGPMEGQSVQGFQVIIVDDASTDETAEVAKALESRWTGIRYIRHKRNLGTPYALNTGVEAAKGQYITIVSADDMIEPWHLETLYRTCEANPHRVSYGNLRLIKAGQRDKAQRMPDYDFDQLIIRNPMNAAIMYPKEAWKEVGGYAKEMVHGREDWAFNIALGIKGWCGVHTGGEPGYLIRREKQNRSLTTATPEWYRYFREQLVGLFPTIYAGERPMGCCGRRGRGNVVVKAKAASNPGIKASTQREVLVGAKGMTLVVFQQDIGAPKTIYGPVTGTAYEFGGRRKVGRADNRDLRTNNLRNPGLLEMYDHGKPLFKETADPGAPPAKRKVAPPVEPVKEPEAYTAEEEEAVRGRIIEEEDIVGLHEAQGVGMRIMEVQPTEFGLDLPDPGEKAPESLVIDWLDPSGMTVKNIRELSGTLTAGQWARMLDLEREGKQRSSAISFIEAAIENLAG